MEMDAVRMNCRRVDWDKTTLFPKDSGLAAAPLTCWPGSNMPTRQSVKFGVWLLFLDENGAYVPLSLRDWQVSNG